MVSKTTTRARKQKKEKTRQAGTYYIRWFDQLNAEDVSVVGGKNASLGEMIQTLKDKGIRVPDGFATTSEAYWRFLDVNQLVPKIKNHLDNFISGDISLEETGKAIRRLVCQGVFPEEIASDIRQAYRELCKRYRQDEVDVAVRSSATAEDLPEASFAGQQESFLNITGEEDVLDTCQQCFASLFTDRAISYREKNGFDHLKVALSVGIQKMIRSDKAGAGVMFSIDTETGFPHTVLITAGWGLGEAVVQGLITPDEYLVFKPLLGRSNVTPIIDKTLGRQEKKIVYATGGSQKTKTLDTSPDERLRFVLNDDEVVELARWADLIEKHYQTPMDMEWAKDGDTGELYIVQARPETVQSQKQVQSMKTYTLKQKGKRLLTGLSIGDAIATGKACIIESTADIGKFIEGSILVTEMTEPDWGPVIKKASAIVTNAGGRTSHAAIVSREYGIPAIVGAANATEVLKDGQEITVSCIEGSEGYIYEGILEYDIHEIDLKTVPPTRTKVMINVASPQGAFRWWRLPTDGIGLARMEFIINNIIKIHPLALLCFDAVSDKQIRKEIDRQTQGYEDKPAYFVEHLARGIAKIAASQYPKPVLVRTSDFKTNEYASLIGGRQFEEQEENPMLGFRGASRYYSEDYREAFALECQAIKRAYEEIGLDNIQVMIPFCRTLEEADKVLAELSKNGLERGKNNLHVYVMCEIPSNVILARQFAERFDGFSIGSNDLTQLVLGVDRDSSKLSYLFDETNEAVKCFIWELIHKAHDAGTKVGICGQAPSDHPDFVAFLVEAGIDSISLNPDSFLSVKTKIAEAEKSRSEAR